MCILTFEPINNGGLRQGGLNTDSLRRGQIC